jgi:isopentenyl diphosphate isomerase/L-lactate dehydrogenase-like FMN-dependent dehydrogenase
MGALRRSMALCGFETLKDLQKAELVTVGDR